MTDDKLPDFLIVGAMKSGTSTLRDHLRRHDEVFIPPGEVHFFNKDERYEERGVSWYRAQFEAARPDQVIGEKTPTYSYQQNVPARIHAMLPEVQLVWIFREPVSRAYSNYWHAVTEGAEPLPFEEVVRREDEILEQNIWRGYLERSRYIDQVERFLESFDLEQMHFIVFESFVSDPAPELERLCDFIGASPPSDEVTRSIRSHVRKKLPRSIGLEHKARDWFGHDSAFYRAVQTLNRKRVDRYPPLDSDLRTELSRQFEPLNTRLADLTGLDLSPWEC